MTTNGFYLFKQYLNREEQKEIIESTRSVVTRSPMFTPTMPSGVPFNCLMTSCGNLGWISDRKGYRYQRMHPNGNKFEPMPKLIRELAKSIASDVNEPKFYPESCLINFYNEQGKLGLHKDDTENNLTAPIISISLGDTGTFVLGGSDRKDKGREYMIDSGDIIVMSGASRNYYHAFKGINYKSSDLLKNGGRLNLTIRQVN